MLEDKVTSLELSKKLVEAGIVLDTYFKWVMREDGEAHIMTEEFFPEDKIICPAPLPVEIIGKLPNGTTCCFIGEPYQWFCAIETTNSKENGYNGNLFGDTIPNAMVKMLLELVERGLIKWGREITEQTRERG